MCERLTIRFLTHWLDYRPGDVAEMDKGYARVLVNQGRASHFCNYEKVFDGSRDKMMRRCKTK